MSDELTKYAIDYFASPIEFFAKHRNTIFRYWDRYATDPDQTCMYAYIREVIQLPNGDCMLGLLSAEGDDAEKYPDDRAFVLLKDIDLAIVKANQE